MLEHIQYLRNIGKFENIATRQQLPLQRVTLIYAENGRGKTTLSAVLRSLAIGTAIPILERQRLGSTDAPQATLKLSTEQAAHVFQDGAWDKPPPPIHIFDDMFVAQNICAGVEIESGHRQNLHELILGATGVARNDAVKVAIEDVETHGRTIRGISNRLPEGIRHGLNVEEFCRLQPVEDIEADILEKERSLATAKSSRAVQTRPAFQPINVPDFDMNVLEGLLEESVDSLDNEAATKVTTHIQHLGDNGEKWLQAGTAYASAEGGGDNDCPYCAQDLGSSKIFAHYRAYFGEAYNTHTASIKEALTEIEANHGGQAVAALERSLREFSENAEFWKDFIDPPDLGIDTTELVASWNTAAQAVTTALAQKSATPLDAIALSDDLRNVVNRFRSEREKLTALNNAVEATNLEIARIKEHAANANIPAAESDLSRSKAIQSRFNQRILPIIVEYQNAVTAKQTAENQRDEARRLLDEYRDDIFPQYRDSINEYLTRFNAGFRLNNVTSANTRGGSTCNYEVVIDTVSVPLGVREGQPSFRNTLSAGDRNTLALAFFFASIDRSDHMDQTIAVIDDPMTSLDEHRSLATVRELIRLSGRVAQLIVLSHSKPFLFEVWTDANRDQRTGIQICRGANGSDLAVWDVNADCVTPHDRRHSDISRFVNEGQQAVEARVVAQALRPQLESFLRVAFPSHFRAGSMLGQFIDLCRSRIDTATPLLSMDDFDELDALKDFGNLFHHDTNPGYLTQHINDAQLLDFARRTLAFTTRPA